ncbi:carboxymuconolactone decarboxylase family protein [Actinoplanes sp. NPDC051411]|uniref:carboxymuconolactone decarboxylase family protein n=1 Tax=Actinoplanes sp. NPDC051411 TaxID=3155522 RepID=UPI003446CAEF
MSNWPRLPLFTQAKESYSAMKNFADTVTRTALGAGVDRAVVHLVKIRVSQVNACAFCVEMHCREARADGVSEQRIFQLDAWRHSPGFFTEAEQAALELAEAVTVLQPGAVSDSSYETACKHFPEELVAHLIFVATVMNSWNRLAISARLLPRPPETTS